jgi:hypothetical protein
VYFLCFLVLPFDVFPIKHKNVMEERELSETNIVQRIFYLRGQKVMLDSDLAELYGVTTMRLNEQVKRNPKRFPTDFMFQLSEDDWKNLISQNAISSSLPVQKKWGGRRKLPFVFTEHGTIMLAAVLNSERAVFASIYVVRAFVKLREFLEVNKELARKIEELEAKYDEQFSIVFQAIRELIQKKNEPLTPIGFRR